MSKKAITLVLAIYLAIAIVLSAVTVLATPEIADWRWAIIIGTFLGTIIGFLFIPGLVPLIFWAFRRFRAERAAGPITVWGFLGALFALIMMLGGSYDGTIRLALIPQNIRNFFSSDQASFTRAVKTACFKNQHNETNRRAGVTEQQMDSFCGCLADALVKQLTIGEFNTMMAVRTGPLPPSVQQKANNLVPMCTGLAFSR